MDTTGKGEMKVMLARLGNAWAWIVAYGVASLLAGVVAVLWPSSTLVVIAIIFAAQLPVATAFTGVRRSADGACYGGGFHHPHLQSGTVGDWPLNVFDDERAVAEVPTLLAMTSAVFQLGGDWRIVPAVGA